MFEKLCSVILGVVLNCLFVRFVRSMAVISPTIVTIRALSLSAGGMVMIGVFVGKKLDVMIRPAIMLPHANRLIGLITAGLFSLVGVRDVDRGCPIEAKKITRKL